MRQANFPWLPNADAANQAPYAYLFLTGIRPDLVTEIENKYANKGYSVINLVVFSDDTLGINMVREKRE